MIRTIGLALIATFFATSANGQVLHAWVDVDNRVVVAPAGGTVTTLGLAIQSEGSYLIPVESGVADPYQFFLVNSKATVAYGSILEFPEIDAPMTLEVGYDFDEAIAAGVNPCEDMSLFWGPDQVRVGETEPAEFVPFAPPRLPPGDATMDGAVAFADFLVLAQNFGSAGAWPDGDFNCDRVVGFDDFLVLAQGFGTEVDLSAEWTPPVIGAAAASVPEPAGVVLLGLLAPVLLLRRKRRLDR